MAKDTCEASKCLDAPAFKRAGWLLPGLVGSSHWTRGGEPSGSIGWISRGDRLQLRYTVTDRWSGEKREYDYGVRVVRVPAPFGGERVWWLCPNARCGRRVAKLYLPPGGGYFLCRRCHGLAYRSQQDRQAAYWRLVDRQLELEAQLEAAPGGGRRRPRLLSALGALQHQEYEVTPLRGMVARWEARERREAERAAHAWGRPGRPSKLALRERARADRREARADREAAATERRPPGRPRVTRPYTRRAPLALTGRRSAHEAFCVRCRDRRPLTYARLVTFGNGRPAIRGRCAVCRTRAARIVRTGDAHSPQRRTAQA